MFIENENKIKAFLDRITVQIFFFRLHNIAVIIPTSPQMAVHNIFLERQLEQSKATTLKEEPIWPIKIKICVLDGKEAFASRWIP